MSFIGYSHLILIISGQMFDITAAQKKLWELNRHSTLLVSNIFSYEIHPPDYRKLHAHSALTRTEKKTLSLQ